MHEMYGACAYRITNTTNTASKDRSLGVLYIRKKDSIHSEFVHPPNSLADVQYERHVDFLCNVYPLLTFAQFGCLIQFRVALLVRYPIHHYHLSD